MALAKIVSGAQTGVDRAALDVALEVGLPCGGWVPRGRRAEDGQVSFDYPVRETASRAYGVRTRLNVRDSDATLIITRGQPTGGTALTIEIAKNLGKPLQVIDLDAALAPETVARWLLDADVRVLNIAGPRESSSPGIYHSATAFLRAVLADLGTAQ
ncbi:MAG: putative molybdenum carrier protein [Rhodospirillales bacterium]|nr:putative molybdenum carrier protein [Rhodospirillales bacterium]